MQVKNVVRVNRILDGRFHAHPKYLLLLLLLLLERMRLILVCRYGRSAVRPVQAFYTSSPTNSPISRQNISTTGLSLSAVTH